MQTPPAYTPLEQGLRHYTPALAALARALFDRRGTAHGVLRAAPEGMRPAHDGGAAQLTIGSPHGKLRLQFDTASHAALAAIVLETDSARRAALAGLWLAAPLASLAEYGLSEASVLELGAAVPSDPRAGVLRLAYRHDGASAGAAVLEASAGVAAALAGAATAAARPGDGGAAALEALDWLALPARLRLRTRHSSAALLAGLRAGDVLLGWPRAPGFAEDGALGQALVLWGAGAGHTLQARARIDSCNLTLESYPATMSYDPDLSLSSAGAGDTNGAPLDVSAVELPVHIEVVTVNLPIGQIAALQPGYILSLPLALADAEIRLVAYGQTLAFGELVAVGDQLGLQIRRIASADERLA